MELGPGGIRPPCRHQRRRRAVGAQRARVCCRDVGPAPTLEDIEAAAQQRVLAYDRAGDGHYDTVSAFIKSLRGNDPDAALYWLATMVAAGEDPRFIARRLIISGVGGRRQRRSAGAAGGCRRGVGARLGRPAGGAIRARPGNCIRGIRAQVEPGRLGLLGGDGRRPAVRLVAGAQAPALRHVARKARLRHRRALHLPARLRGRRMSSSNTCPTGWPSSGGATTSRLTRATSGPSATGWRRVMRRAPRRRYRAGPGVARDRQAKVPA